MIHASEKNVTQIDEKKNEVITIQDGLYPGDECDCSSLKDKVCNRTLAHRTTGPLLET